MANERLAVCAVTSSDFGTVFWYFKPSFVSVGDQVKKGQTLMIIEAMKVMNEVPSPKDGIVTEILVQNEEMVEFGKGLVRIK